MLPTAFKAFKRLDLVWRDRIDTKLRDYAADPKSLGNMVTRLKGDGKLRLRVGDYRVIFTDDGIVLAVHHVGHRREIYRGLQ